MAWIKGRLHQQGLDEASQAELREALDKIATMDPEDTRAVAAFRKLKERAPSLWELAKPLLPTLVSETLKKLLLEP